MRCRSGKARWRTRKKPSIPKVRKILYVIRPIATVLPPDLIRSAESTSARQRLRRRQLSFIALVVAAAPNGCSYVDIAERRRHRSEFIE